jgi:predicted ferric reductase
MTIDSVNKVENYTIWYQITLFSIVAMYSIIHYIIKYNKLYFDLNQKKTTNYYFNIINRYLFKRFYQKPLLHYMICILYTIITILFIVLSTDTKGLYLKSTGTFLSAIILIGSILPLKNSPLKLITELTYDKFLNFHKFIGVFILLLSILHTIFYIVNFSRRGLQNNPFTFKNLFVPRPRAYGTIALILIILINLFSVNIIRKKIYNLFHISHYMYILFIIFTALHRPYFIPYMITIFAIVAVDYAIRLYYLSHTYKAGIKVYGDEYVTLHFETPSQNISKVGKHVYILIPEISKFESHPFSIISHTNSTNIELGIKSLGDYTSKLIEYGKHHQLCDLKISGMFGSFGFNYLRYEELVLICGGVGVTPFIGLLKDLYHNSEYRSYIQSLTFVWFCRDDLIYDIYSEFINTCVNMNTEFNENLPYFMPIISIKTRMINTGFFQTIDVDNIFVDILHLDQKLEINNSMDMIDFNLIDIHLDDSNTEEQQMHNRRVGVICCGVPSLINDVWDKCYEYSNDNIRIDFCNQSFAF